MGAAAIPAAAAAIPAFEGLGMIGAAAPALGAAAPAVGAAAPGLAGALGSGLAGPMPTIAMGNMMVPTSAAANSAFTLSPLQQLGMSVGPMMQQARPYMDALKTGGQAMRMMQQLQPQQAPMQPQIAQPMRRPAMDFAATGQGIPNPAELAAWRRVRSRMNAMA